MEGATFYGETIDDIRGHRLLVYTDGLNEAENQQKELLRSVGAQYATGDQWRNNSRKNEGMAPKQKNTQLWMWLVIEARSHAVKSNTA